MPPSAFVERARQVASTPRTLTFLRSAGDTKRSTGWAFPHTDWLIG